MRPHRADLSNELVHLIKDLSNIEAARTLAEIAHCQFIIGTTRGVLGGASVVCFSEAPRKEFIKEQLHFNGFGVAVDKEWLFSQGGRPVIYQARIEHGYVAQDIHWKCVTYEPTAESWVDWTWQREWRIQKGELWLPPDKAILVTPSQQDAQNVIRFYNDFEKNDQEQGFRYIQHKFQTNGQCPYQISVG